MANRLAFVLRRTAAKEAHVKFSQLAELVGNNVAEELSIFRIGKQEITIGRVGPRSAIPAKKRVDCNDLVCINVSKTIEAIEAAMGSSYQIDGTEPTVPQPTVPDIAQLPPRKVRELKERNLIS
jgi:hypothetical protein